MNIIIDIFKNFFTHKDYLPPASEWPGTLFSPLQIVFCTAIAVFIVFFCIRCAKKSELYQKKVFFVLWVIMLISEIIIDIYDCCAGKKVFLDLPNILPLWHCSIFLYAAPFAIFSKGNVKFAACGYICTLGLLGGLVNFVYPATYISAYSCISFAGFRTIFYHGAMIFTALTMLISGYHSFKGVTKWQQLLLPCVPALIVSVFANIVNYTIDGTDYMFFKMESFFFAPIGKATPDWLSVILVYILLFIIHGVPYLPSYLANREKTQLQQVEEPELITV